MNIISRNDFKLKLWRQYDVIARLDTMFMHLWQKLVTTLHENSLYFVYRWCYSENNAVMFIIIWPKSYKLKGLKGKLRWLDNFVD